MSILSSAFMAVAGRSMARMESGNRCCWCPSGVIDTHIERLSVFRDYRIAQVDPTVRNIVLTYCMNMIVCVLMYQRFCGDLSAVKLKSKKTVPNKYDEDRSDDDAIGQQSC